MSNHTISTNNQNSICPNCGAPIKNLSKCEYCDTILEHSDTTSVPDEPQRKVKYHSAMSKFVLIVGTIALALNSLLSLISYGYQGGVVCVMSDVVIFIITILFYLLHTIKLNDEFIPGLKTMFTWIGVICLIFTHLTGVIYNLDVFLFVPIALLLIAPIRLGVCYVKSIK